MNVTPKTTYLLSQKDLLAKLNGICIVGYDAPGIKELLAASLKITLDIFEANRGSIYLLNANGNELSLNASEGINLSEQKLMSKRLGEGIIGQVAELKKPIRVEDIATDERFKGVKSHSSYRTPSFICAPLMLKDKLIGVINIADKESGHYFTQADVDLLDFISSQIALNYLRVSLNQSMSDQLGKTSEEAKKLKGQVLIHERLASIGKLAGGIAHEFNNPLDGVMRYTNLSLEHLSEDDTLVREYLLEVRQGLKRMANIVKSLLACARNSTPTMNKIDVNLAIEHIVKDMHPQLHHKNIHIHKKLDAAIQPITDLGIERIISNLLSNAIDAVEISGEITIETLLEVGQITLKVSDNGKGIKKEDIEKIFEPFFTTKLIDQGCGLGLTIVSEIVKHYKGDIAIQSILSKGTTFTVILPIEG